MRNCSFGSRRNLVQRIGPFSPASHAQERSHGIRKKRRIPILPSRSSSIDREAPAFLCAPPFRPLRCFGATITSTEFVLEALKGQTRSVLDVDPRTSPSASKPFLFPFEKGRRFPFETEACWDGSDRTLASENRARMDQSYAIRDVK